MRYCHKTNSILLRIMLCDSFNTLFLGNAQDLFKFMGFSLLDFLKRRPCRPNFSNCFPFVFRSRFDFCQMPITCTKLAMLFQIPVFSLSAKWGLDVLPRYPMATRRQQLFTAPMLLYNNTDTGQKSLKNH